MSTITVSPNMSENIRAYGKEHGVFGADEIRRIHGEKAALLCSRLARKGQFTRIKNGVYSMLDDPDAQDEAYERYLERLAANRAEEPGPAKASTACFHPQKDGEQLLEQAVNILLRIV